MAGNRWLRDRLPADAIHEAGCGKFMPGETQSPPWSPPKLSSDGIAAEFTRLGENLVRIEDADEIAEHYFGLIGTIKERPGINGEVSVKLTPARLRSRRGADVQPTSPGSRTPAGAGQTLWVDSWRGAPYVERTIAL